MSSIQNPIFQKLNYTTCKRKREQTRWSSNLSIPSHEDNHYQTKPPKCIKSRDPTSILTCFHSSKKNPMQWNLRIAKPMFQLGTYERRNRTELLITRSRRSTRRTRRDYLRNLWMRIRVSFHRSRWRFWKLQRKNERERERGIDFSRIIRLLERTGKVWIGP